MRGPVRQGRSRELGVDGRLLLSGGGLFAIFGGIGSGAVVVAVAGAFVLVLGASAADGALAWCGVSIHLWASSHAGRLTRAARLLLAACQAGRVDAAPLCIGTIVVCDKTDRLGLGRRRVRRSGRRDGLIHEKQSVGPERVGKGRINGPAAAMQGRRLGWGKCKGSR